MYELVDGSATEPTVPEPTPGPDGAPTNAIEIMTAQRAVAEFGGRATCACMACCCRLQVVPAWIKTSLYHDFSGDGAAALNHLRATFDAARGDGSDHAVHLKRIGESVIESRRDLNEEDLRKQYNMMMTAKAAIQRTNNAAPDEATLKAMFDNALPIAYSQIRMLVRRQKHATFLLHYTDYMNMVRSEISARRPAPAAYGANANDGGSGSSGGGAGSSNANGNGKSVCIRCGRPDCKGRRNCDQPKARCRLCGADHLVAFCPKATGNHRRGELPAGAPRLIDREMAESLAKRDKSHARAAAGAATSAAAAPSPHTPPQSLGLALPPPQPAAQLPVLILLRFSAPTPPPPPLLPPRPTQRMLPTRTSPRSNPSGTDFALACMRSRQASPRHAADPRLALARPSGRLSTPCRLTLSCPTFRCSAL